MKEVKNASETTGEKVWELPLWKEYRSSIKGKYADIIAVSGNPLEDISVLESVDFVMKDGSVVTKP